MTNQTVGWSILASLLLLLLQLLGCLAAAGRPDDAQTPIGASSFKSASIEYEHFFNHGTTSNPKSTKFSKDGGSGGSGGGGNNVKLENEVIKSKVEVLGEVLKQRVQALRNVPGQKVELVFLVDSSASVGAENFFNELKFVKKLLADFTVSSEAARVSVVTFSSKNRVVRHIDHISPLELAMGEEEATDDQGPDDQRHKCRLLEQELPAIGYTGGGTYTLGALLEAQSVLDEARPDAVKAVFLITDGYSNGGDPRPAAKRLREQGVRIFTFGIRNGNVKELYDMASEPAQEHSYIVDSFEEFEALARRALHEDLQTGSYLPQRNRTSCDRLCKEQSDCCHSLAQCTCGTHTGHYACLCPPGHYGTGLKDDCHPCPGGTYRSDGGPGDLRSCKPCPDENHISEPGSTSVDQCQCPRGYVPSEEDGGRTCQLLACPKLEPPANGYFVKQTCNSVFNGACGIRCNGGYKLVGSSIRLCQENGTWSGEQAVCQMRSCGTLPALKNGRVECTSNDHVIDSECTFSCDVGFSLVGSRKRVCLPIGYWDGLPAFCKPVFCNPVPKVMNGTWAPSKCPMAKMRYGEYCNATCATGFELRGPATRRCSDQGSWTEEEIKTRCVDVTPPEITCPSDVTLEAEEGEHFATYSWDPPVATDNSGTAPDVVSVPAVTEQPMRFRIGNATVTYRAQDRRGNQAECSFQVIVTDNQPPTVDQCESPPTFLLRDRNASVVWDEPVFSDNSGRPVIVERSHEPGRFPLGETEVLYTATDESGNNSTCTLTIRVQEHACHLPVDPIHGQANCSQQPDAVYCSLTCHDGYAFAMPPPRNYFCAYDGQWLPADSPLPFPDCSVTTHSDALIQDGVLQLTHVGDSDEDNICQDPFLMSQMEGHFKRRLAARLNEICGDNMICQVDDLQAECRQVVAEGDETTDEATTDVDNSVAVPVDWEQSNEIPRSKREIVDNNGEPRTHPRHWWQQAAERSKRNTKTKKEGTEISKMKPSKNAKGSSTTLELRFKVLSRFNKKESNQTEISTMATTTTTASLAPAANVSHDIVLNELNQLRTLLTEYALAGDFNVNYTAGRLLNILNVQFDGEVERPKYSCPAGSVPVKDESIENFARCVFCPVGTFFNVVNEVCESCSQGSYQPEEGQLSCLVCPGNTSTKVVNAKRSDDCQAQCLAGSYSPTTLEPCSTCPLGTYQTEYSQKQCLPCPPGSTTWRRGARRIDDCKSVCPRGHVSETGLSPCFACPSGFYQPLSGQKYCIRCPRRSPYTAGSGAVNRMECLRVRPVLDDDDNWVNGTDYDLPEPEATEEFEQATLLEVNECFSLPCQNGGQCRMLEFGYVCDCPAGYSGMQCQTDMDDCASLPCSNGGTCVDGINSYQCQCPTGFSGIQCQTDIDECLSGPCHAGATCLDKVAGYSCICPPGMAGPHCELEVDECVSGPCQNGGTCYDRVANYTCVCPPGWAGKLCEQAVDECLSQPCLNGATCEDLVGHFVCHCPTGYDGPLCHNDIDECEPQPCAAGSTCLNRLGSFACLCPPGVVGSTCDTVVDADFTLEFTSAGKLDYAVWEGGLRTGPKPLDQLTLCAWMKTVDQQNYGTLFSYATDEEPNSLTLTDYSGFVLYVNGAKVVTDVTANDGFWHLICATWSSLPDGQWRVYFDGEIKDKGVGLATNTTIDPNGTTILGQEQDVRAGGFNNAESFVGQLYGVELWNTVLDAQQIAKLTLSCRRATDDDASEIRGNLLTWADFKHGLRGGIRVEESVFCRGCSQPIPPLHGGVAVGANEAVYQCDEGYVLSTSSARRPCLVHGGWFGPEPECQRISCGFPGYILNGLVNGTQYVYGDTVSYNCTRGFRLSGKGLRTCQEDGQWSGTAPECIPVTCDPPTPPVNGSQVEPANPKEFYSVGDRVSFQCGTGFRLDGPSSLTCQDEGQWDDVLPVCQPLACTRPPYVEHGIATNGVAEILPEDMPHYLVPGSILTFACHFGYQLESTADVQCSHDGYWIGHIPKCVPIRCGTPPQVDHASVQLSRPDNDRVGSVASYVCQSGYEHFGPTELECTETGTWLDRNKQATLPICMLVDCGSLPIIENGEVYAEEQTFGSRAPVNCYSGFKRVGSSGWIECGADNRWTKPPRCLPIACNEAPQVRNATQTPPDPVFAAGEEVKYDCHEGFRLSGPVDPIVCESDGSWLGQVPECLPEECPSPERIENGAWAYASATDGEQVDERTTFYTGAEVLYSCDEGFILEGGTRRRCVGSSGWVPLGLPVCRDRSKMSGIACPALDNPDRGTVVVEGFEPGQVATYECDTGFHPSATSGPATLVCNSDGTWSVSDIETDNREPFQCEEVACAEPEAPVNGSVSFTSTTFGSKALFRCDQGFVLNGSQQRTCGSDGVWIGGQRPRCVPRVCTIPDIIEHGYIGFEVGGSATSLSTGSVILYDCEEGYKLVGVRERSCLASGDWADEEPSCHQIFCERLPNTLPHGTVTGAEENVYGSVVQFACEPGYELDGPERLTCEDDENWNGIMPTCKPIECPSPGLVANIVVALTKSDPELSSDIYHYGDVLTYTCRKGYAMPLSSSSSSNGKGKGNAVERRCLADGSWSSKPPVCSRVACPAAAIPQNGYTSRPVQNDINHVSDSDELAASVIGEVIQYGCKKGYMLASGPMAAKCLETGKWNVTEPPICRHVRCPQPPTIKNGKLDGAIKNNYTYLDKVEYICDPGFRMTDDDHMTCTASGEWSEPIPSCIRAVCLSVDLLEDGFITPIYPSPDGQKSGRHQRPSALKFSCRDGYELVGSALAECTSTGEWSHPLPSCAPWPCESPPVPPNGQLQSTQSRPGVIVASIRCDPGFQLVGTNLTCGPSGGWTGKPECRPQPCSVSAYRELWRQSGVEFEKPLKDNYNYGEPVHFRCREGYVLTPPGASVSCGDGGQFVGQMNPSCAPVRCPDVHVPLHGSIVETTSMVLGGLVSFSCQDGYRLDGEERITCRPNGTWSRHPPTCVARSCADPPPIENGWNVVHGHAVGDTVSYSCQSGYRLTGDDLRTCQSSGSWSGEDPACDAVVCPVPEAPEHGTWTIGGFVPGSTIRYECQPGYALVGSSTITCLIDKTWSDMPPKCQQITCSPLKDPDHGSVQVTHWISEGQELSNDIDERPVATYRSVAHYKCDLGYQLFGPDQRTCTLQGAWSDRGPQCQRIWCPEPQAPVQGFVMGTGKQYGDKVRYACGAGYRLLGATESTCNAGGMWSNETPQCEALTCDSSPPTVHHAIAPIPNKSIVGTELTIHCQDGFAPIGDLRVQCLPNQQWSIVKGQCKKVYCSRPIIKGATSIAVISGSESVVTSNQFHYGDRVLLTCQNGRRGKSNSAILVCQGEGQWVGQPPVCDSQCDTICLNGGSCSISTNGRKCYCPPGYSGDRCQHAHCILPCLHGGTCVAPYRCACSPGRTGERCQTPICDQPCLNGGRCVAPNSCQCPTGTIGPNCRKRSDIFSSRG